MMFPLVRRSGWARLGSNQRPLACKASNRRRHASLRADLRSRRAATHENAKGDRWLKDLRRLALAIGTATVAGCAVVLGLSAALDVEWAPGAAVFLALTAVWLPQSVIYAGLRGRRK